MNTRVIKKTSQALALFMFVSILLPVLALAAVHFENVVYNKYNRTVSGSVYSDTYNNVGDSVYLTTYASGSSILSATYATYNPSTSRYDFRLNWSKSVSSTTYDSVNLNVYFNSVFGATYSVNNSGKKSSPGGGGGGASTSTNGKIDATTGSVSAYELQRAFDVTNKVEITIKGEKLDLPLSALLDALKKYNNAQITVISDNGTYTLPLSVLNGDALAKSLSAEQKDVTVTVTIAKKAGEDVTKAVYALGAAPIAIAVDFNLTASAKGKTVSVDLGKTFVSRTLNVNKNVDSKKAAGVVYNETTKTLSFVPTTFETTDGKTVATLKRNSNSIYTVIESNKSFDDLASHWAQSDVELLANKLVVDGVTADEFQPDRSITRAEFAALVVRSLSLNAVTTNTYFTDVNSSAWYANTVASATYAGIINGYEDNTFRPDAEITREELAAMVVRAANYAGIETAVSSSKQAEVLSKFDDADSIVWAQAEVAAAINAGLVNGLTDSEIAPVSEATRAQAATMLKRFLTLADFID
ncbi:S-layer domain-containing protein [Paenibacillus mucilaginosus 3016]|uniref:S-layer domain-containing protein n=1 Tax=Paenibacillus mucilaginosus 3016 TaxID=1116391 RepID=H6NSW9_9BACL|nr:S-layer homology domain-containing protein [Paenibacillus mucilaginosus]AFC27510.1 S-layer domain-containing protein [Paenibacillus mucilaginosus 3016]WFA16409.1 S-layer homology domain-containing protein [Paenibacillus mucilaginosus]